MGQADLLESVIISGLVQLDLTRYRQPLERFDRTFSPDEVRDEGDPYRIVSPVHVAFDIHKDKDKFRLVGNLETELEPACSRCLEPYRLPLSAAFDLRYLRLYPRPSLPRVSTRWTRTTSRSATTVTTRST